MSLPAIQATHSAWVFSLNAALRNSRTGSWPGPGGGWQSGVRSGRPSALKRLVANLSSAPPSATNLPSRGLVQPVHGVAAPGALVPGDRLALFCHRRAVVVGHAGEQRIQHRDVDMVAPAGPLAPQQRHQHARKRHVGGQHVGGRDRRHGGPVVPAEIDAQDARHRLDRKVVGGPVAIGAVLAVGRDRDVDDPRIARPDRGVADAQPIDHARPEGFDEHVAPSRRAGARPRPPRPS